MKRIYWRPRGLSRPVLALIAGLSVCGMTAVERFQIHTKQPHFEEKWRAATLARRAMQVVREARLRREPPINRQEDPANSGLIGEAMTAVTSDPGSLAAKQASINPNFAAVLVQWLISAGVKKGDVVALGASGSFPALNICVYAALQTLEARPVIISGASASQWGANLPDFLWLDMEKLLFEKHIFSFRTAAASLGGVQDRGVGMETAGRQALEEGIRRSGVPLLAPGSFDDSVEQRMEIYRSQAGAAEIRAYINIGGGTTSVGTSMGKNLFQPGLNLTLPAGAQNIASVMTRFSAAGVPVIHLIQIERLAAQYGLPLQPRTLPAVGEGKAFYSHQYNLWLATAVLIAVMASLYAFIHTGMLRVLHSSARSKGVLSHEPMI
jgi:poly-gamma-glutamate system protein